MLKPRSFSFLAGLCLVVLCGCGSGGKIAAMVNGQVITVDQIEDRMNRLSPQARNAIRNDPKRLLDEMITETVLIQEAKRRGVDRDREVSRLASEARRQIVLGRLLEVMRNSSAVTVTPEEVSKIYQENQKRFVQPEMFRASHILVEDEETAKKALEKLKGGGSFAQVAQEFSIDPSKTRGGDIGGFTKGQLLPEFEAACAKLNPGQMSDIVTSALGWHITLMTEHQVSRQLSQEEVSQQIERQLTAAKQQGSVEESVLNLRKNAHVQIRDVFGGSPTSQPVSQQLQPSQNNPNP